MGRGALRVPWRCASTSGNSSSGSSSGGGGIRGSGEKSAQLWTMQSRVRDVLLCKADATGGEKLWKFVEDKCKLSLTEAEKEEFIEHPEYYIDDKKLYNRVVSLPTYKLLKTADYLESLGIIDLQQWKDYANKDTLLIIAHAKGLLDSALVQKTEIPQEGQVLTGLYESIYDAKWDYVFNNPNGDPDRFWLEVKDGSSPPQEWSDEEVEYLTPAVNDADAMRNREEREVDFEDDEDNVQPTRECLQMKVLTSTRGWPYKDSDEREILDCYITKEVERAWRFIKDDLFEWFDDPSKSEKKPRKRIMIGTPGIGKSMAAGSYLLYQLLHYNIERLPVVAYFIGSKAYIFDKTSKQVAMYDAVKGLRIAEQLAQKCNGYIIYDCSGIAGEPPLDLPDIWGTTLISSPNAKNFKAWEKYRSPTDIVINCPTTADLKAMHMWKQHNNNNSTEEILSEWAVIKERAEDLGPLPRFVFDRTTSKRRKKVVETEINVIDNTNASQYVGVSTEMWATKSPCHKIAMILRESTDIPDRMDYHRNAPLSGRIKCKLIERLAKLLENNEFLKTALFNANHAACVALENYGCGAFRNKDFVTRVKGEIQHLKRVAPRVVERICILQNDLEACPSEETKTAYSVGQLGKSKTEMSIEFKKLYIPQSRTFPLVDAFFFARSSEGKTILVGLQTTTASRHPTKTGIVCQFMNYLSKFDKWADHSKDLVMEIIYVQSQGVNQIDEWQKCPKVLGKRYSAQQHEEAYNFWNNRVFQYHLCLSDRLK